MRIRLSRSARTDINEGKAFYDNKQSGLGDYFVNCIKADIHSLLFTAGVHSVKYRDYHRMVCHTFPFAIYYTKIEQDVVVYAVVDCRRAPAWFRKQLRNRST